MRIAPRSLFDGAPGPAPTPFAGVLKGEGWHPLSKEGWSAAPLCTLLFDPEVFPPGDEILLELALFNAGPADPRVLTLESDGAAPVVLTVGSPLPVAVAVPAPAPAPGARHGRLRLRLDRIASPSRLGVAADDRLLGLRLLGAGRHEAAIAFPLDFGQAPVRAACLGPGWSTPEPGGLWSEGEEARLFLPRWLWRPCRALAIDLAVLPRPADHPSLALRAEAAGLCLAQQQMGTGHPQPWMCPLHGLWEPGAGLEIVLRFDGLATPADLGINADTRLLGLFLRSIAPVD